MNALKCIIASFVLLSSAAALAADEGWEKKSFSCARPKDGCDAPDCCELSLTIFTRDVDGVRQVRGIAEIDAPPSRVFDVITDYAHYTEFMPRTVGSRLLKREGNEVLVWGMVDPPMISRRDWVTQSLLETDLPGGVYRTTWHAEPTLGPPPDDGVVRMTINTGSWTLQPIDGGMRTRATYEQASDPGGHVPTFIVKAATAKGIPQLVQAVRDRVASK